MSTRRARRTLTEADLVELLAAQTHAAWARWTDYLLTKFRPNDDGSITLPGAYVRALRRQVHAPYDDLSAQEQQADRDEVAHLLPHIRAYAQRKRHPHDPAGPDGTTTDVLQVRQAR